MKKKTHIPNLLAIYKPFSVFYKLKKHLLESNTKKYKFFIPVPKTF